MLKVTRIDSTPPAPEPETFGWKALTPGVYRSLDDGGLARILVLSCGTRLFTGGDEFEKADASAWHNDRFVRADPITLTFSNG